MTALQLQTGILVSLLHVNWLPVITLPNWVGWLVACFLLYELFFICLFGLYFQSIDYYSLIKFELINLR